MAKDLFTSNDIEAFAFSGMPVFNAAHLEQLRRHCSLPYQLCSFTEPPTGAEAQAKLEEELLEVAPRGIKETLNGVPQNMRFPVVCAVLPLAAAYADAVTVQYCDGGNQRLGLMSIIVGPQASGKSVCSKRVALWLRQMEEDDDKQRAIEEKWKEEKKGRKANEKAPEDPHVIIRNPPVTTTISSVVR